MGKGEPVSISHLERAHEGVRARLGLEVLPLASYAAWYHQRAGRWPGQSPYHHPSWLEAVAAGSSHQIAIIGFRDGPHLVGAMPGFLTHRGPLRLYGSPLRGTMTAYLGPIGDLPMDQPNAAADLIEATGHFIRRTWLVQYAEITLPTAPVDYMTLGAGWRSDSTGSYVVDLRPGREAVWANLKARCRRNIRKAERLGLRIVPLTDTALYYRMLVDTYRRRETVPTFSERFYQSILERLVPLDLLWAWGVEYQGTIIAAGLFLHDEDQIHYLSGASLSEYRTIPASYLLHWQAMTSAMAAGLSAYDFVGRGIPSIDQFKEAFNPAPTDYWSVNWASRPAHLAKQAFLKALPHLRRIQLRLRNGPSLAPPPSAGESE